LGAIIDEIIPVSVKRIRCKEEDGMTLNPKDEGTLYFRNLEVYKRAICFLPIATGIADGLPPKYVSLADQLRRAAVSIPLNIAEGTGQSSRSDQRRYFAIARGSAMESAAIIDACRGLNLIQEENTKELDCLLLAIVRMLSKMCLN
jgi:four helix bundle protein